MDVTIEKGSMDISLISEKVQEICEEKGLSKVDAMRVAMAVEEIAVYTANKKS
jgi:anti-sigma regulatory factor (Ser/Thr protein kinase)